MNIYQIIANLTKQGFSIEQIAEKLGHPIHAVRLGLRYAQRVGAC